MKIFNQIYGSVATWLWATLVCMALAACEEDALVKGWPSPADDGKVTFTVTIPDYALPTRADAGDTFDPAVTSLHLYLFDNQGYFTGIVEAQSVADPAEKDKVLTNETNTTATYSVSIPQNTDDVHFIANHPQPDNAWIEKNLGRTADAIIPPMVTDGKVYWGKSTFGELTENDGTTFSPTPVVLYRNYAMVTCTLNRSTNSHIVENGILGWTLCNVPSKGTVAPFDNAVIGSGAAGEPFHFNLTTGTAADRFATMPLEEADRTFADNPAGTSNTLGQPIAVFDHTIAGYGQKKMYAVFQIKTTSEIKFYKIALIDGNKEGYDIKRNHRYTINFKDINPALGYTTFAEAATDDALAANDNVVDIQETLPELQSSAATLSVVNGTVRYIDDLTTHTGYIVTTDDAGTRYSVNDIYINYTGKENLKVSWKENHWGSTGQYQPEIGSLTITPTTGTFNGKAYTHIIRFDADAFALHDNGNNHFKEGLIRVAETDGPLSRFVRVYIGEPISFRPLLISSDIPAMTDERLTVAFNVPDTTYLPRALYPIEIRFGSDRIDVEKNIFVESMKVEQPATEDYSDVLEWKGSTGNSDWNWTATGTAENTWGYKYVYTLDSPEEAVRQHRITLRTVNDLKSDFSVLMEGLSTVLKDGTGEAEAKVFNTRELKFHMQAGEGTAARRIMLNDGMHETRLVTAYKYAIANASGQTIVSIPYTLGTYNDETNTKTTATGTIASTLWIYYDPDVLEPCNAPTETTQWWGKNTRTIDPEGNTYVTVNQTTATGTLYFQTKSGVSTVENSLVFITARSTVGYGTYNTGYTSETTGYPEDYINTGVNATGSEYRSASAIINVKDKWQFNPAPSTTNGNFAHAEEFAMPYGCTNKFDANTVQTDDNLLYVRIERPAGTSGVKLEIETEGKLQLMDNDGYTVETFTYTDKENQEQTARYDGYANNIEVDDKKVTTIKLTLTDANTDYCVLRFRALKYNCACTITLKSAEGSAVPYETDYLKITNEPISVSHIAYMTRAEYEARRVSSNSSSNYSVDDSYFKETSIKLSPVPHANYVVRAYLPTSAKFATLDQNFIIDYKAFKSVVLPGLIFSTGETRKGFSDKYGVTANDNNYELTYSGIKSTDDFAYVDILLQSKDEEVTETPRIESDRAIGLYRYSLSGLDNADAIEERDAYEMWFSDAEGAHANGIMTNATDAEGQEVFQTFSPGGTITGQTITALGQTFTQGAKFNSNGNMAIAVPKDNMFLTVVAAAMKSDKESCAGFNVMTLGTDGKDSFTGEDDYADDIDQSGTVVVYPLNKSGEYILRRKDSGAEFPVYYARLSTTDPGKNFSNISWTAIDDNNDNKGGVTSGTVTSNRISVSDFHEKLTLTIPLETVTTLKLSANSAYKFKSGGDYIQNVTPTDGNATITLVPVTPSNGELIDGTFTLSGSDANGNVYNAQEIEVYVRPYVIADGLYASDGTTYLGDKYTKDPNNNSYVYIPSGEQFNVKITIPNDPQTIGKNATLNFGWNGDGGSYVTSTNENNNSTTLTNIAADASYNYTWEVSKAGGNAILKLSSSDTDILRGNKFQSGQNFWPYLHTIDDTYVKIGVGSWYTAVRYSNVKVTNAAGTVTYIGEGKGNYTTGTGTWNIENGILSQTSTSTTGSYAIHDVPIPSNDYKLTCKATKTDGSEGFLITFNYAGEGQFLQWNIGGWGNKVHTIESHGINGPGNGGNLTDGFKAPDNNGISGLITTGVVYNIEITVKDGIATCICTPTTVGNFYLEYIYDITNIKRESHRTVKMENTYEYYITDNTITTTERYKHVRVNGAAQTSEIDVIKMNGAYAYRNDGGSVTITPYDGNSITLGNGEHMGGNNQYITLKITYPIEIHYKWTPRTNHDDRFLSVYNGNDNITSHNNNTSVAGTIYEVTQKLSPGEYTVKSSNGETVLWYLKLTPYIPSN